MMPVPRQDGSFCESVAAKPKVSENPFVCICKQGILCKMTMVPGDPVEQSFWGIQMRKGTLLLAILIIAAAPTAALAKKKKAAAPKVYSTTAANANESSARLVRDGISQIFVPFQSVAKPVAAPAKPKAKKKAKKKTS